MGLHNMNKTLLLATAVTAAVFGAHGAAAAVTGNPQTYTTNVTLSGAAVGTGVGTGIAEFDDTGGTGGIAAFKTVADTVTTVTTPGLGTATVSSVSVYDGTIVGTTFTSNGTVALRSRPVACAWMPLSVTVLGNRRANHQQLVQLLSHLDLCTGGTWTRLVATPLCKPYIDHTLNPAVPALCPPAAPTEPICNTRRWSGDYQPLRRAQITVPLSPTMRTVWTEVLHPLKPRSG